MRQFSLCTATQLTFSPVPASLPPFTPRPSSLPPSGTHTDEDSRTQTHTGTYALTTTHHTHSTHRRGDEEVSRAKICGAGQERERKRRVPLLAQQYLAGSWCVCVRARTRARACVGVLVLPQRTYCRNDVFIECPCVRVSLCKCGWVAVAVAVALRFGVGGGWVGVSVVCTRIRSYTERNWLPFFCVCVYVRHDFGV